MKRLPPILSFVLFVAVCASTSFWVMQFMKPAPRKISAPPAIKLMANVESVAGLFGGAMAVRTNYLLKGIVFTNPADQSGAIIAVDGKPGRAYRVNAEISPGVKLSEVHPGYVLILDNGISKRIELPQDFKSPQVAASADTASAQPAVPAAGTPGNRRESDDNFVGRNLHVKGGFRSVPANNRRKQASRANNSTPPDNQ